MFSKFFSALGQIIIWFIILFLIAGLAIWGIGDILTSPSRSVVAKVGNSEIYQDQIDNVVNKEKQKLLGRDLPEGMMEQFVNYVTENAVMQEVNRKLLELKAEDLSIEVDRKQIIKKEFIEASNMDKEQIQSFFRNNGGEEYFLRKLEIEKKITFMESVFSSIPLISQEDIESLHVYGKQKRGVTLLKLNISDMKDIRTPTDEEIKNYYETNKNKYLTPEFRSITYVEIDSKIIQDEEALKDENIIIDTLYETSGKLLDSLAEGMTVEEAAKNIGTEAITVRSINDKGFTEAGIQVQAASEIPNFVEKVFSLEEGETSDVMESPAGNLYIVVRVDSITPQKAKDLGEVKPLVVADIKRTKKLENLLVESENLQKEIEEGKDINEVIKKYSLETKKIDEVSRDSTSLPSDLVDDIFNVKVGKATNVTKDKDGNLLLAVVDRIISNVDSDPYEVLETKDEVERELFQESLFEYLEYLKTNYKVSIVR